MQAALRVLAGECPGKLIDHTTHWHLIYDRCGHIQEFARIGIDEVQCAAREVRRYFATCLTCRLGSRDGQPGSRYVRCGPETLRALARTLDLLSRSRRAELKKASFGNWGGRPLAKILFAPGELRRF